MQLHALLVLLKLPSQLNRIHVRGASHRHDSASNLQVSLLRLLGNLPALQEVQRRRGIQCPWRALERQLATDMRQAALRHGRRTLGGRGSDHRRIFGWLNDSRQGQQFSNGVDIGQFHIRVAAFV